jgi:outer membrane protein assembly factor BamB
MFSLRAGMITLCVGAVLPAADRAAAAEWPYFGGPNRNFTAAARGLAQSWPDSGPKRVWSRELGEGYAGVAADGGVLYTMYRRDPQEVVAALDAATGKTLWEYAYAAPIGPGLKLENGPGPHVTPVVVDSQVCTVGILAQLNCFDKKTGKLTWSRDLYKEYPTATKMGRGFSCNPLPYKGSLVLTLGAKDAAVVALSQKDGSLVWATRVGYGNGVGSPLLIDVGGQAQLVALLSEPSEARDVGKVVGIDPNDGRLLWEHAHPTAWGLNIALPVWGSDRRLFISSAYGSGSRMLELHRRGDTTEAREVWFNRRMRVHHSTIVRIGDVIYGSSGDFGPAPLTAVDAKTGDVLWQDRTFSKANFVYADGKLIVLDEDGNLALAQVAPEGLKVVSRVPLLTKNAWTAPSLAGTRLFVRDRKSIMALDLGSSPP